MDLANRPLRVAIVDDDLWIRGGRAQALAATGGIEVAATLSHGEALERDDLWAEVDVALVDAWDRAATLETFPGVGVVEAIRRARTPDDTVIIVITGHVLNDVLRLRMSDAGADLFYGHDDVASISELAAIITEPDQVRRPGVKPGAGSRAECSGPAMPAGEPRRSGWRHLARVVDRVLDVARTRRRPT